MTMNYQTRQARIRAAFFKKSREDLCEDNVPDCSYIKQEHKHKTVVNFNPTNLTPGSELLLITSIIPETSTSPFIVRQSNNLPIAVYYTGGIVKTSTNGTKQYYLDGQGKFDYADGVVIESNSTNGGMHGVQKHSEYGNFHMHHGINIQNKIPHCNTEKPLHPYIVIIASPSFSQVNPDGSVNRYKGSIYRNNSLDAITVHPNNTSKDKMESQFVQIAKHIHEAPHSNRIKIVFDSHGKLNSNGDPCSEISHALGDTGLKGLKDGIVHVLKQNPQITKLTLSDMACFHGNKFIIDDLIDKLQAEFPYLDATARHGMLKFPIATPDFSSSGDTYTEYERCAINLNNGEGGIYIPRIKTVHPPKVRSNVAKLAPEARSSCCCNIF